MLMVESQAGKEVYNRIYSLTKKEPLEGLFFCEEELSLVFVLFLL